MSRQSGYILTIKAFIPSPKSDFAKQAAAALAMDQITKTNTLPENFAEIAKITDIAGKFGSVEIEEDLSDEDKAKAEADAIAAAEAAEAAQKARGGPAEKANRPKAE